MHDNMTAHHSPHYATACNIIVTQPKVHKHNILHYVQYYTLQFCTLVADEHN